MNEKSFSWDGVLIREDGGSGRVHELLENKGMHRA